MTTNIMSLYAMDTSDESDFGSYGGKDDIDSGSDFGSVKDLHFKEDGNEETDWYANMNYNPANLNLDDQKSYGSDDEMYVPLTSKRLKNKHQVTEDDAISYGSDPDYYTGRNGRRGYSIMDRGISHIDDYLDGVPPDQVEEESIGDLLEIDAPQPSKFGKDAGKEESKKMIREAMRRNKARKGQLSDDEGGRADRISHRVSKQNRRGSFHEYKGEFVTDPLELAANLQEKQTNLRRRQEAAKARFQSRRGQRISAKEEALAIPPSRKERMDAVAQGKIKMIKQDPKREGFDNEYLEEQVQQTSPSPKQEVVHNTEPHKRHQMNTTVDQRIQRSINAVTSSLKAARSSEEKGEIVGNVKDEIFDITEGIVADTSLPKALIKQAKRIKFLMQKKNNTDEELEEIIAGSLILEQRVIDLKKEEDDDSESDSEREGEEGVTFMQIKGNLSLKTKGRATSFILGGNPITVAKGTVEEAQQIKDFILSSKLTASQKASLDKKIQAIINKKQVAAGSREVKPRAKRAAGGAGRA